MSDVNDGVCEVVIPYTPRPIQAFLHNHLQRFNVLVCHRGMGKTVFSEMEIIRRAFETPNGVYIFLAPYRAQVKRNTWKEFKDLLAGIPQMKFNESELLITFPNGARIFLMGADNYHAIRGMHLDGVVLDEVAQMDPEVWTSAVRPTLTNKKGWAIFIGTKNGEDLFYDLYHMAEDRKDWFRVLITAYKSGTLGPEEIELARNEMGQEAFDLEMGDAWTAGLKGSYYGAIIKRLEDTGRLGDYQWDPKLPVMTAWDLGLRDKTVIWFAQQTKEGNVYLIDYHEGSDQLLEEYAKVVLSKPYTYSRHILPHDAARENLLNDKTCEGLLRSLLGHTVEVAKKASINDGINASQLLLSNCSFNVNKCYLGLSALKHYRTEYNAVTMMYNDKPKKDWSNHAADAFRYLAMEMKKPMMRRPAIANNAHYDPLDFTPAQGDKFTSWDPFKPTGI